MEGNFRSLAAIAASRKTARQLRHSDHAVFEFGMSGGEVREGFRDSFGTGHAEIVYVICFRGMWEVRVDDAGGKVSAIVPKAAVMIDIGTVIQLLNNAQVLLDGRLDHENVHAARKTFGYQVTPMRVRIGRAWRSGTDFLQISLAEALLQNPPDLRRCKQRTHFLFFDAVKEDVEWNCIPLVTLIV